MLNSSYFPAAWRFGANSLTPSDQTRMTPAGLDDLKLHGPRVNEPNARTESFGRRVWRWSTSFPQGEERPIRPSTKVQTWFRRHSGAKPTPVLHRNRLSSCIRGYSRFLLKGCVYVSRGPRKAKALKRDQAHGKPSRKSSLRSSWTSKTNEE